MWAENGGFTPPRSIRKRMVRPPVGYLGNEEVDFVGGDLPMRRR